MIRRSTLSALALVIVAGTAAAQNPPPPPKPAPPKPAMTKPAPATHPAATPAKPMHRMHGSPALLKKAKVKADSAEAAALAAVPGGTVTYRKIETQKGVIVYVFNVKTTGMEGYNVVTIDANTGALVSNTHKTGMMGKAKKPTKKPATP